MKQARTRRLHKILPAVLTAAGASMARAELVYDGFNYSAGSNLGVQADPAGVPLNTNPLDPQNLAMPNAINPYGPHWYGAGTSTALVTINGTGLSAPAALQPAVGGDATWTAAGTAARIGVGPISPTATGNTVYWSALLKIPDVTALATTSVGSIIAGFNTVQGPQQNTPSVVCGLVTALRDADGVHFNLAGSRNSGAVTFIQNAGVNVQFNAGQTYLIVGAYTINSTSTSDAASLWVDPDPSSFGAATPPTANVANTTAGAAVSTRRLDSFMIRRNTTGTAAVELDELRIDQSWAGVTPQAGTTLAPAGGTWSAPATWVGGVVPDAGNAAVNLNVGGTVTLTNDAAHQVNYLNLNGGGNVNINGAGTLTLNNGATISAVSGSHTISAPVALPASLSANIGPGATVNVTQGLPAGANDIRKAGFGTLMTASLTAGRLILHEGKVTLTPGGAPVVVNSLEIPLINVTTPANTNTGGAVSSVPPPHGTLDIADGKVIVHATGVTGAIQGTTNTYSGLTGLIQYGRNGGGWSGTGIVTSQSSATSGNFTSIGVATAQQAKGLANAADTAIFAGKTVTGSDTLIMYTYGGDANLDGKINVDDYGHIDSSIGIGLTGWYNGDFNYDGKVNVDDYGIIDFNIGIQGPTFPTGSGSEPLTAVPEPTAFALIATGLALGVVRRRRPLA